MTPNSDEVIPEWDATKRNETSSSDNNGDMTPVHGEPTPRRTEILMPADRQPTQQSDYPAYSNSHSYDVPATDEGAVPAYPNQHAFPTEVEPAAPVKHSGMGITSLLFGIVSFVLILAAIVTIVSKMSGIIESGIMPTTEEAMEILSPASLMLMALEMFGSFVFALTGFILGIAGIVQKNRKKGFAIAGTVVNALYFAPIVLIIAISILSS